MDNETFANVQEAFERWDVDGDGTVSREELQEIMTTPGMDKAAVSVMFDAIETDGSGTIEDEEFMSWVCGSSIGMASVAADTDGWSLLPITVDESDLDCKHICDKFKVPDPHN